MRSRRNDQWHFEIPHNGMRSCTIELWLFLSFKLKIARIMKPDNVCVTIDWCKALFFFHLLSFYPYTIHATLVDNEFGIPAATSTCICYNELVCKSLAITIRVQGPLIRMSILSQTNTCFKNIFLFTQHSVLIDVYPAVACFQSHQRTWFCNVFSEMQETTRLLNKK